MKYVSRGTAMLMCLVVVLGVVTVARAQPELKAAGKSRFERFRESFGSPQIGLPQSEKERVRIMTKPGYWERDERVIAYLSERRARYVSITRARDGRLLILFTHQTTEQEEAGTGDLFLVRRTKDGKWWFYPVLVYEGQQGEPRAYGTMTTLSSGKIIAPFAELDDQAATSEVRMLISEDDGETWRASAPISVEPLCWAAPYGRPFELKGELVMPVFGALTQDDLAGTRLCSGLLRSADGGQTWGKWSTIAGPDPAGEVSYEFPAVAPLSDGTLLAVLTARQLKERPHLPVDIPQALMRTYSSDGGATWTEPEHLAVGSWASLTRIDDQTLACSFAIWAAWGAMEVMFSDDGFHTIRHRLPSVEHNWLPGCQPSEWGTGWARKPIPLPPVVPHLKGDWSHGHYGFSSGLALDRDHLLLVLGQRQTGTSYTDPPHEVEIPLEKERVEAITVVRVPSKVGKSVGPAGRHGTPKGQWQLAERWSVEEWKARTGQPPVDVSLVLQSGRWVRLTSEYTPGESRPSRGGLGSGIMGQERGHWVWKSIDGLHYRAPLRGSYSDDQGQSWHEARIEEPVPLAAATHPGAPMFEEPDGTLVAPVYGYFNDEDMSVSLYVSALCRSHDGGESWGDWSIIGYDGEARYTAYSETTVLPLPDGTWVAFLRSENRSYVPQMAVLYSRCVSTDRGRTWSPPEPCAGGGNNAALVLPDGGLAIAAQNTCGWGVMISYDYGRTWNYALPATYVPGRAGVLDDKTFWMYDGHPTGGIVSIYRLK